VTDLFDVIHHQRACRRYAERAVTDDVIGSVLDAATYAPSAENRQPWQFVVVRDEVTRAALLDLAAKAWESGGRAFSEERLPPRLLADVDQGIGGGGFRTAPVLVVVAADTQRSLAATVPSSIFPATQNLLLAATALGLGSALTTISLGFTAEIQALLDLPEHVVPQAVVPLGYPLRPLGPPAREPFATHTHRDRWGNAW
jgi:nitroreductase